MNEMLCAGMSARSLALGQLIREPARLTVPATP
jgi:hypothetical protein